MVLGARPYVDDFDSLSESRSQGKKNRTVSKVVPASTKTDSKPKVGDGSTPSSKLFEKLEA